MGGQVQLVVRFSDGSIERRSVWTNSTSYWLTNLRLVTEPDEWMRKYVDPARFEKVPERIGGLTAPDGYGLIVVDCKLKKLTEMQSYTSYGQDYVVGLSFEMPGRREKLAPLSVVLGDADNGWVRLAAFLEAKRLVGFHQPNRKSMEPSAEKVEWETVSIDAYVGKEGATLDDLYQEVGRLFAGNSREARTMANVLYDMKPWVINDLPETVKDLRQFQSMLQADGFDLTAEDLAVWKEWIDERTRNDEEDGVSAEDGA